MFSLEARLFCNLPRTLVILNRTLKQSMQKTFTIIVEGNIGSGKTTFIDCFKKCDSILTLNEPVQEWKNLNGHNLLSMSYDNLNKWAFTFQTYVQLTVTRLHEMRTSRPVKIMERSLFSARYCFVENLYNQGILPPAQLSVLDEWFKWLIERNEVTCDLIVYLRTTPEVAFERIKLRNRTEEKNISLDLIKNLHIYHEDWLFYKKKFTCPAPVLVLDANRDVETVQEEYKKECKNFEKKIFNCAQMHL